MTDREKTTVLLDYEVTRNFIDKIDGQLFQIKGWALFTASGVIAYGVSQKSEFILLTNIVVVSAFCFLEMIYKTFHETAIGRMPLLERIIHGDLKPRYKLPLDYRFGLGAEINPPSWKAIKRIFTHPGRWHLVGYYFMIILGTIFAAIGINFIK